MRALARQTLIVWLALLGVLFGTLAPALSHAMAHDRPGAIEMQICSGAGMTTILVQADGQDAPAGDGAAHLFEHCPYCSQSAHQAALLSSMLTVLPAPALGAGYPARFYQSATPLFPWTAASPRAPPAS